MEKLRSRRSIGENHHEDVSNILCILTDETQNVRAMNDMVSMPPEIWHCLSQHPVCQWNLVDQAADQEAEWERDGHCDNKFGQGYRATVWKA